jgi:hypothetical protein
MKPLLSLLLPLLLLGSAPVFAAPATCPQMADQLTELLAGAKQRIAREGDVRVEFDVDAGGHAQLVRVDGSRAYRAPVRLALDALECHAGDPQRYVLNIRFADPVTVLAAAPAPAASSTLAQAPDRR